MSLPGKKSYSTCMALCRPPWASPHRERGHVGQKPIFFEGTSGRVTAEGPQGQCARASSGIRTHDLPLTERVLYQLSYRGHGCKEEEHKLKLSSPPIEHQGRTAWKNARSLPGVSEEAHVWVRREDQLALDKRSSRSD